jgi:hypothetical protein
MKDSKQQPTIDELHALRRNQWDAHNLAQEKLALIEQAQEILEDYVERLNDDLKKFASELPESSANKPLPERKSSHDKHGSSAARRSRSPSPSGGQSSGSESMDEAADDFDKDPSFQDDELMGSGAAESSSSNAAAAAAAAAAAKSNEPVYCICRQVSHGRMVACDDENCRGEWFHFSCVGLTTLPEGKWYCPECQRIRSMTT